MFGWLAKIELSSEDLGDSGRVLALSHDQTLSPRGRDRYVCIEDDFAHLRLWSLGFRREHFPLSFLPWGENEARRLNVHHSDLLIVVTS